MKKRRYMALIIPLFFTAVVINLFSYFYTHWFNGETVSASVSYENIIDSRNYLEGTNIEVNVKSFGAEGDGLADDTAAVQNAFNEAETLKGTVLFPTGTYLINDNLLIPDINIKGDQAVILISNSFKGTVSHELAIRNKNFWGNSADSFSVEGITFKMGTAAYGGTTLGLNGVENVKIKNCYFENSTYRNSSTSLDLYSNCKNIIVENCVFDNQSDAPAGGVWVRSYTPDYNSENIVFKNCKFNNKKADEAIAVWGASGTVKNIWIRECEFNSYRGTNNPAHLITLGNNGTVENLYFENNIINADVIYNTVIKTNGDTNKNINILNNTINIANQLSQSNPAIYLKTYDTKFEGNIINADSTITKAIVGSSALRYKTIVNKNKFNLRGTCYAGSNVYMFSNNEINGLQLADNCQNVLNNNFIVNDLSQYTTETLINYYDFTSPIYIKGNILTTSGSLVDGVIQFAGDSNGNAYLENNNFDTVRLTGSKNKAYLKGNIFNMSDLDNMDIVCNLFSGNSLNFQSSLPSSDNFRGNLPIGTILHSTSGNEIGWVKVSFGKPGTWITIPQIIKRYR
ncbi:MAG: glycosyl hydrolase family 28-related protein [Clostridiaceae bacterium]